MKGFVEPILEYLRLTSCADKLVHFVFIWTLIVMGLLGFLGFQIINNPEYVQTLLNVNPSKINPTAWASQDAARNAAMTDIRDETDADRIFLFIIHDGIRAINDYPALYASAIAEVVRPGIAPAIELFQQRPIATFGAMLKTVQGECIVYDPQESTSTIALISRNNTSVRTVIRCPVFDPQGRPLGFLSAAFLIKIEDEEKVRQVKLALQRYSAFMAGHMVNR